MWNIFYKNIPRLIWNVVQKQVFKISNLAGHRINKEFNTSLKKMQLTMLQFVIIKVYVNRSVDEQMT